MGKLLITGILGQRRWQYEEVTNPITGRTWMDRNLGAEKVAESYDDASAYGWTFQWGRNRDGHQFRDSGERSSANDYYPGTIFPGHSDFLKTSGYSFQDNIWYTPPLNDELWQPFNYLNLPWTQQSIPGVYEEISIDASYYNTSVGRFGDIQTWTVPKTGLYTISAYGARGGGNDGGLGAKMSGRFYLIKDEKIDILVGQQGLGTHSTPGGGGGTFVVKKSGNTNDDILLIAGGGGGSPFDYSANRHASIGTSGNDGEGEIEGSSGGNNGSGGSATSHGGGGGGFFTSGSNGTWVWANGGYAYINGGDGGIGGDNHGGFGGGGGAYFTSIFRGSGGGGGYSGGGGAKAYQSQLSGGGGGSYNNGTYRDNAEQANSGHGYVIIETDMAINILAEKDEWSIDIWRLPTKEEWESEMATWASLDTSSAFASDLKLTAGGYRGYSASGNNFDYVNERGYYWSQTIHNVDDCRVNYLRTADAEAVIDNGATANGMSVRLIKDVRTKGVITYKGEDWGYEELTNYDTGRTWMDRNLGAYRPAQYLEDASARGDLFQWGRLDDGHQNRDSDVSIAQSSTDVPGHDKFLGSFKPSFGDWEWNDWREPENEDLWQSPNLINIPAPIGWRIPTKEEWEEEIATWPLGEEEGGFRKLKIIGTGYRGHAGGAPTDLTDAYYWSITTSTDRKSQAFTWYYTGVLFPSFNIQVEPFYRIYGMAVRLIREEPGPQSFTYKGEDWEYYEVTNPVTGRTWMDRNLGAHSPAYYMDDASAYGDLFQWGRGDDFHQNRDSSTTTTLSDENIPGHGDFIISNSSPYDWRDPQNDDLWQIDSCINIPAPDGWRLPTKEEWESEMASWGSDNQNREGAFYNTGLKLPCAGFRLNDGSIYNEDNNGHYWSLNVSGTNSYNLFFGTGSVYINNVNRSRGLGVRLIKDPSM